MKKKAVDKDIKKGIAVSNLPPAQNSASLYVGKSVEKEEEGSFKKMIESLKESLYKLKDPHEDLVNTLAHDQEKEEKLDEQTEDQAQEKSPKEDDVLDNNSDNEENFQQTTKVASEFGSFKKEKNPRTALAGLESHELFTIKIEIDRLKAQHEALNESRKMINERFLKVAEDTGSLRANVLSLEKELRDITVRVSRAIDLVEEVQPEKLFTEVKRQDAKIQTFDGKLQTHKELIETMSKELKDLRSKLSFIKGIEQIVKITEDVHQELKDISKTKAMVDQHANKIESMYLEIKTKFSKFEKYEEIGKDMQESVSQLLSQLESIKLKADSFLTKEQLDAIKEENEEALETTLTSVNDLKEKMAEYDQQFEQLKQAAAEISSQEIKESFSIITRKIEDIKKEIGESKTSHLEKEISIFEKKMEKNIAKALDEHYEYAEDRYAQLQKELKQIQSQQQTMIQQEPKQELSKIKEIEKQMLQFQAIVERKLFLAKEDMEKRSKELVQDHQRHAIQELHKQAKNQFNISAQVHHNQIKKKIESMQQEHHEMMVVVLEELNHMKKELAQLTKENYPSTTAKKKISTPAKESATTQIRPKTLSKGVTTEKLKMLYG